MPPIRVAAFSAFSLTTALSAQAHWTRHYPAQSPVPRLSHAMAFDPVGNGVMLFGGLNSNQFVYGDTWRFQSGVWSQYVGVGPSARFGHGMVCDAVRSVVVLFGGTTGSGSEQDTWEWNGNSWSQRGSVHRPPSRSGPAMAYDRSRMVTVLFGGSAMGDTWEWNGLDWVQRTVPVAPPIRSGAAMAFDPVGGGVILFGGSYATALDDTWRWDGASWQEILLANPPYARSSHVMVTDFARQRIVMFGGLQWDPNTWEWDGTTWSAHALLGPIPRLNSAAAYDPVQREALLYGGGSGSGYADTWTYGTDTPALFETIGLGCAGSAGTPLLANAPYSLPWLGDMFTTRVAPVPANGALLFATGFEAPAPVSLAPYGMPGCDFAVQIAETRLAFATAAGSADWSLAIPNSAGLAGVAIAQQVLVLDPGANAAGAVVSSAGRFIIGIR
ncbi:MAG: kelch repeat-containing protein [Planctomycetota bacterium]